MWLDATLASSWLLCKYAAIRAMHVAGVARLGRGTYEVHFGLVSDFMVLTKDPSNLHHAFSSCNIEYVRARIQPIATAAVCAGLT